MPLDELLALRFAGMEIEEDVVTYETVFHRVPTRELTPAQLIFSSELGSFHSVLFLQTIPDTVLALDGATGDILWRYQHKLAGQANKKMGLALQGDKIFVATSDLHVIGLNAKTGALIWDQAIAADAPKEGRGQLQMRSAPLIVKDKLIQGVTSS